MSLFFILISFFIQNLFASNLDSLNNVDSISVETNKITIEEKISGFRIQLFITDNFKEATEYKNTVDTLINDEWIYIDFDSPNYKVRVGDFLNREDAKKVYDKLKEKGFPKLYIVPCKVRKNPPIKTSNLEIKIDTLKTNSQKSE